MPNDSAITKNFKEEEEVARAEYFLAKMVSRGYTLSSSDCSYLIRLLVKAWALKRVKNI